MFQRILVAVDGSEHSLRAADYAIKLVSGKEKEIDIIYVISGTTSKSDVLNNRSKIEISGSRKSMLKKYEEKFFANKVKCDVHVLHGEPGPTIVDFANKGEYDCMVLGSRGLNKLQSLVLGSVSHKVAKYTVCPVLIIK
ncbi:universal stress protein [Alkalihalobacillus deserti]|uniref:universal stress protein n=1 Tax=Alkalihalobacillus deserti TaxID=2879466 RepID=UPI001D135465|nr:universal stress protein [Alkalihalobacillus deserti]